MKKSFVEYEISIFQLRASQQYKHARGEYEGLTDFAYRNKVAKMAAETSKLSRFLLFNLIDGEIK